MGVDISLKNRALRGLGRIEWLRGRDRIVRAFADPDTHKPQRFESQFFGLPYTGDLANFIDWNVFYYGAFSINELRLLGAIADALHARGKPVYFFDIGANIGQHTLFMARYADQGFAFEPFAPVRQEMEHKLRFAGVQNVQVFPVALGNRNETASFHPPKGANQGAGTLSEMPNRDVSDNCISVEVVRGDDFFRTNELPHVSLLKVDVEGFEINVLEGLRETLMRDRPPILMEIQPETGSTVQSLLYPDHLLFQVGHAVGGYALRPFVEGKSDEALVLPAELAGLVPGTQAA